MALTNLSQITTSGIATGTDLNIRNITGAAATFTGNVTVGGTLTYEDVTNIDSVGLITARSGINVNSGDVNITSGNLALASATPMVVASNGSGHLRLGAGGSEKVRIKSDGKVGIGVTNPSSDLEISQDGSQKIRIYKNTPASTPASNGNNTTVIDFIKANSGSSTEIGAIRWRNTDTNGSGTEYTAASIASFNDGAANDGNLVFNIANNETQAEALRITSTGSVGIGTDNPTELLHLAADSQHRILLKRSGAAPSEVSFGNEGNLAVISNNANGIDFRTGSTPSSSMHIDQNGRVGIRTDDPEDDLHIFLDSSSDGPSLRLTNPNGGDGTYTGRISTGDTAGTFFAGINFLKHDSNDGEIRFRTKVAGTNTDVVTIVDGNVGVGLVNPTQKLTIILEIHKLKTPHLRLLMQVPISFFLFQVVESIVEFIMMVLVTLISDMVQIVIHRQQNFL